MAGASQLQLNVVASDRPLWSGAVASAMIPVYEGAMGVLPNHQPMLVLLKPGKVAITLPDGTRRNFQVGEGFASFDSNKLTLAVETGSESETAPGVAAEGVAAQDGTEAGSSAEAGV